MLQFPPQNFSLSLSLSHSLSLSLSLSLFLLLFLSLFFFLPLSLSLSLSLFLSLSLSPSLSISPCLWAFPDKATHPPNPAQQTSEQRTIYREETPSSHLRSFLLLR